MYDNYNYPEGTDTPDAPWNEVSTTPVDVEVTVSITLSKTVTVSVDDYTAEPNWDEEGYCEPSYDFSECDLKRAVQEQIDLPMEHGWTIDDFEVVRD